MNTTILHGRAQRTAVIAVFAFLFGGVLVGCNSTSGSQATADSITRSVYNNDADGASANFDDALKQQVTRASVGTLSDRMHKVGDYKGLTYVSSDPLKNEFDYRADFTNGSMMVVMRLDSQGKVAAYRVFPLQH